MFWGEIVRLAWAVFAARATRLSWIRPLPRGGTSDSGICRSPRHYALKGRATFGWLVMLPVAKHRPA